MNVEFAPLADPPGIRIRDPIENAQFELYTDAVVDPKPADPDQFVFPVDAAVTVDVAELEVPQLADVILRTDDGSLVGESTNQQRVEYPPKWYSLNIDIGAMKLQAVVDGAVSIRRSETSTHVEFPSATAVSLGARSLHESPAGTITVGDGIEDAMRAVSYAGSALKTTSCERSFPTLRGHPPLVERGDAFRVPDGITKPETDVTIEIPRDYGDLYRVSSLAYYLGADVVPGDGRTLVAGDFRYDLDTDRGFESEVNTLLKHVFFLDCVTRTEGLYPVTLAERDAVADDLTFDPAALYDASLADQLRAYLDVPYEVTEPHWPRWKLTADFAPEPEHVESVPFVANELGAVRIPSPDEEPTVHAEPDELAAFYRSAESLARSATDADAVGDEVVKPRETAAIEHAWIGAGFPLGASKTDIESYRRRLDRPTREREHIGIDVVCNEPEMSQEDIVAEFYGTRDLFEFDIDVHYELSGEELAEVLQSDTDFLHYIGHVDDDGFQCSDGMFDARTLSEVNVDAFLLNACRSYEQGEALVERGSLGGIVTLANVSNDPAVRIGRALSRLLNSGFTLQAGLSVARNVTLFGNQYITIGDGTLQLVQHATGTPISTELERVDGEYELSIHGYPTSRSSIGSLLTPNVAENTVRYLNSGLADTFRLSTTELREFFNRGVVPVMMDGELVWSDELLEGLLD
ncbi:hypothetical protein [Halobacterium litoreum]|uniref:CHAT domain-containing protein n=1 Tax=Halobacterium litoreum TaxID=2039234 RepID=A0ABD5NCU2_9EURY|nr:hypothetical protein [Halobacterium litoreum]UHH14098.1 hypothetical protein LT972_03635 [Halobacterium litoreum]